MAEAELLDGKCRDTMGDALQGEVILIAAIPLALLPFFVDSHNVVNTPSVPRKANHHRAWPLKVVRNQKVTKNLEFGPAPKKNLFSGIPVHLLFSQDARLKAPPVARKTSQRLDQTLAELALPLHRFATSACPK